MGVRSGQKTESMKQTPTPLLPPATHPCMAAPAQNALQTIRTHGWMSKNALRGAGDARVRAGQGTAKNRTLPRFGTHLHPTSEDGRPGDSFLLCCCMPPRGSAPCR